MHPDTGPRAIRDDEYEECLAVQDGSFRLPPGYFVRYFEGDPWYKNDYCRVYSLNGKIVSALHICRREIRIGSVTLLMGGIGNVGTQMEHRHKGYSSQVLLDSARVMDDEGMDVSFLYTGIHGFYERVGWRTCPTPFLTGRLKPGSRSDGGYTARDYDETKDAASLLSIYDEFNAGRAMSAVRNEFLWRNFAMHKFHPPWTIRFAEKDGKPVAYSVSFVKESTLMFDEVGFVPGHRDALGLLMRQAADEALQQGSERVRIEPGTDADVSAVAEDIAQDLEFQYKGWTMVRFFNLQRMFQRLLQELSIRARAKSLNGSVCIETEIGSTAIESDGSEVRIIPMVEAEGKVYLTQPDLARLIFGTESIRNAESKFAGPASAFLLDLFPLQPFVYWEADMF